MGDLLGIGASGVYAYRSALATIGDNVANSQTEGYSRRDVQLREQVSTYSPISTYRGKLADGGVALTAVTRAWDAFKTSEARVSLADAGRADTRVRWLTAAENALPDNDGAAASKLTMVFTSADALAADPGNQTPRRAFLAAVDEAAAGIREGADGLKRVADGIATEAKATSATISADLVTLSKVNDSLRRVGKNGAAQASLMDQRDRLIDQISSNVAVDVKLNDDGTAELKLAGSSGATLLDSLGPATVTAQVSANGRVSFQAAHGGVVENISPTGGALAGLVSASNMVADRRQQLDQIAVNFANQLNQWQAAGTDANGTAGTPLLSITGGSAATLTAVTSDPSKVAAAKSGQANGNLLALQNLRAGGVEEQFSGMVADQAQVVSAATAEQSATSTRRDNALASRDETVGVDLDKEAAELLRFQQAYDGSARVIQVARETLQSILNLF